MTLRKTVNKKVDILRAERKAHVPTLATALQAVENFNPGIGLNVFNICNLKEVEIDATKRNHKKAF